jgi:hypothetical protein
MREASRIHQKALDALLQQMKHPAWPDDQGDSDHVTDVVVNDAVLGFGDGANLVDSAS